MVGLLISSIARAGGIEVSPNARLGPAPSATPSQPRRPGLIRRISRSLTQAAWRLLCRIQTRRRARTAIRELRALPDRTLRDIGLPRSEIRAAVAALLSGDKASAAGPASTAKQKPGAELLPFAPRRRPAKIGPCERAA
ncbi:MAG: DUF1127 domain-containing protein [Kiloniellales bacterium]